MADKKSNRKLNIFLNKYSDLIGVILACIVLVTAFLLFIRPQFKSTVETITSNIEDQKMIFEQQSRKLQQLKANLAVFQKIDQDQIARLNQVLPDKYIEEKLFGELEEIISKSGYTISAIEIRRPGAEPPENSGEPVYTSETEAGTEEGAMINTEANVVESTVPESLKTVEVHLSIGSIDYAGLKNLLPVFENSLRLMDIIELNFSPSEKKADLVFKTYYYQLD